MRQHTRLVMLAVAGCAAVATAACTSPSTSTATPPVAAPSASAGVGEPGASSGVGEPADEETSPAATPEEPTTAPTKKPSTGQGGQSGEVDWKRVAFRTLGCKQHADLGNRAELHGLKHADLTGDGRRDAIVTASCPTTTSTNAVHVFVFDGNSTGKPLLDAGKKQYFRTADVKVSGRTIEITAEALSTDAPLCCPDLVVWQSWKWTGSAFETEGQMSEKKS